LRAHLAVDVQRLEKIERHPVQVFKTIIIGIYLLAMLGECKSICSVVQWIQGFPRVDASGQVERRAGEADAGAEEKGEEEEQAISGITDRHRYTMVLLTVVRLVMLFILTWVGLMFLLKDTDYINLLLNAMGLIVVVELTEEVYACPGGVEAASATQASMAVSQLVKEGDADISVLDKNELEEKSPDWFAYESLLATKSAANASSSASGRVAKRRHAKMHHDAGKLGV